MTLDASLSLDAIEGMGLAYVGYLPVGSHHIRFDGEDRCGNKAHGEADIEVTDCKQPVPICNVGIGTVVMPSNGEVTVWAVDVDGGTKDDCSELTFGIRRVGDTTEYTASILLTCEDLEGSSSNTVEIEMQVTDDNSNEDFCTTFINLQDNEDVCGNGGPAISGTIETRKGEAAVGHEVYLLDVDGEVIDQTQTDEAGHYGFFNTAGATFVSPDKNDDVLNGVNTLDLLGIQRHFLGIDVFEDPYKVLASDVTHEDQINVLDLLELQEVILGLRSEFSNNRSWRYVSEDEEMTMATAFDIEEPKDMTSLSEADRQSIDFIAVKVGDVDGTADASGYVGSAVNSRTSLELVIETSDIEYGEDDEMRIPVRSSNFVDVKGYQYTLSYDTDELSFVGIESGGLSIPKEKVNSSKSDDGMISTNWYDRESQTYTEDEVLFTLMMRGKRVGSLEVSDAITTSESYRGADDEVGGLTIDIRTGDAGIPFALYQNVPNPFDNTTLIGFDIPADGQTVLKVYDVRGKEIYRSDFEGRQGYNERRLKRSDLDGATGVLYYRVETDDYSATKKMMLF